MVAVCLTGYINLLLQSFLVQLSSDKFLVFLNVKGLLTTSYDKASLLVYALAYLS